MVNRTRIESDYVYVRLVLFVSKIIDSSELLSYLLLIEMGVEYCLVCIKYYISN